MNLKKTPLYEEHLKLGGKIIDFAGWLLPVQYKSIIKEHEAVRNKAGIFDVSHMGEILIKGKEALHYLQMLLTNDLSKMNVNQTLYTIMCYPDGGVVDDLLVYKTDEEDYCLVVNAANIQKDFEWMIENKKDFNVIIENVSENIGQIALQGSFSQQILQKLTDYNLSTIKPFHFVKQMDISQIKCLVSRTGYTGEDGFEIYCPKEKTKTIWNELLKAGEEFEIEPAGLGARDTLRFEAALPLYGHEISKTVTPLEGGVGFFVKLNKKENFIGKEALLEQKQNGLTRKVVGFEMKQRGLPRENYDVLKNDKKIGYVTTGYYSPTLKKNIGFALINIDESNIGNEIEIVIRNKPVKAEIINKKFYKRK